MLTDDQLKALGLDMPPPQVAPDTSATPSSILPPSTPPPMPRSIMGYNKIPQGAMIPTTHEQGKEEYQQYMPQITSAPGTADYFRQRQEQLDYKSQHPWGDPISAHPGILGKIGHVAGVVGNVAGTIMSPAGMSMIPGSALHNALESQSNERGILRGEQQETAGARASAENEESAARVKQLGAETEHTEAETDALTAPAPRDTFEKLSDGSLVQLTTDPHTGNSSVKLLYKGDPKVETDVIQRLVGGKPHNILVNKQTGVDIKDLGEKKEEGSEGTWSLQEDAEGKPILLNSKTAQVQAAPGGVQPRGTAAKQKAEYDKDVAGPEADLDYADNYLKNRVFTGAGDEALMEKFFDLAKPSSGFRMSQPQIDMQVKARSWMGGLEAHLRHATTGTWFSDEQRQQIADTMKQLHDSKVKTMGNSPTGAAKDNDPLRIR